MNPSGNYWERKLTNRQEALRLPIGIACQNACYSFVGSYVGQTHDGDSGQIALGWPGRAGTT